MVKGNTSKTPPSRKPALNAQKNVLRHGSMVKSKNQTNMPNLALVDREEAKANAMFPRHTIVKIREKNRARFVQVIQANLHYLVKKKYLSTAELAFLFRLLAYVKYGSNALVAVEVNEETGEMLHALTPVKISELAKDMDISISQARRLVSSLLKKGILYEVVDAETLKKYGRPIEERPLFVNPELVIAMDKNRIDLQLCRIHWENDKLEKGEEKIKLPWKIWYAPGGRYGRLYARKTWLKKRKQSKQTSD